MENDAWSYVRHSVAASNSKYVLVLFVDFRCAFDFLSCARIIKDVWKRIQCRCPQDSVADPFGLECLNRLAVQLFDRRVAKINV